MALADTAIILPIALTVFLLCMFLVDTVQVLLRVVSTVLSAPILGAHLGSVFMLLNRVTAALALLIIGYLVDTEVSPLSLLVTYTIASLLIALVHIPLLKQMPIFLLTSRAFKLLYRKETTLPSPSQIGRSSYGLAARNTSAMVIAVTSIGLFGLLAPSLLASSFPDYRATLMQTGFIINSIASILNVFYVERHIAVTLDGGDIDQIDRLYSAYTMSRALGYLLASGAFLAILLFLDEAA